MNVQVMFAELVAALHEQGKSASQHLKELYERCLTFVVMCCRPLHSLRFPASYGFFQVRER